MAPEGASALPELEGKLVPPELTDAIRKVQQGYQPAHHEDLGESPNAGLMRDLYVAMGEPVNIKFEFAVQSGRVIMDPKLVKYVGRGGELYASWNPFGGSPKFDVRDSSTGEQIAVAVFGGT